MLELIEPLTWFGGGFVLGVIVVGLVALVLERRAFIREKR